MAQASEVFLFQPTSIPGCQLWLDAADVNGNGTSVANGATVSTWVDKSGNTRNATGTGPPTYDAATRYVLFNGSSQFFTLPNGTYPFGNTPYSIFVVAYTRNAANPQWVLAGGNESTNQAIGLLFFTTNAVWHSWWVNEYRVDNSIANNVPSIVNISYSTTRSIVINGGTASVNSPGAVRASPNTPNYIGRRPTDASQFFNGGMAECIIFNSEIPTSQRQQVEGYLAWKWGLVGSLPSNHPFKTYRPLAATPIPTSIPPMPSIGQTNQVFVPTQISGCSLWLDGGDVNGNGTNPVNGATVSTWVDKSGNSRNASGYNNTATYNTGGLNTGYPGLEFSSTKSMRSSVPSGTFSSATFGFVVYKFVGTVNLSAAYTLVSRTVSSGNGIPTPFDMYSFNNQSYRLIGNGTNFTESTASPNYITNSSASQYNFGIQSSATSTWNESVNGAGVSLTTSGGSGIAAYGDTGSFITIGGRLDTAVFFNGVISEVIFYNSFLTTSQRQQVEGYLAWKWGLVSSLPNGHPYKVQQIAPFSFRTTPFRGSLNQWQPSAVSGCVLWLDAADRSTISLSGSSVTQWRDKSASGYNFVPGASPTSGVNTINGLNVITTNGSQHLQITNYSQNFTAASFFCVIRPTQTFSTWSFLPVFMSQTTGAPYFYPELSGVSPFNYVFAFGVKNVGGLSLDMGQSSIANTTYLITGILPGNATNFGNINGSLAPSSGTGSALTSGLTNVTIYAVGIPGFGSEPRAGQYGEMIMFNRAVSTQERQQVEGYLAWKWGLQGSLPANHPFRLFPPSP